MADTSSLRLFFPRYLRDLPADLAAILGATVLLNAAVFTPMLRETLLRVPLGLVFVLFVPGYVFVAALFPERGAVLSDDRSLERDGEEAVPRGGGTLEHDSAKADWSQPWRSRIDGLERIALSIGLSIAIVPLIGLVLNFTPWGLRLVPIMTAVTGFTIVTTAVAVVRRWALPETERFVVPYRDWIGRVRTELLEPDTRTDAVLNVLLVVSLLIASVSVGYAVMTPPEDESFSAIYLLTEDDTGELVAEEYPTEFETGESHEMILGVDNHEGEPTSYTTVAAEQDAEVVDNETIVAEQRELDRFETRLDHNETWRHEHDLEPTMTGEDVRIVWLLYLGDDVPEEPSTETADYHVHLWVDVADAEADGGTASVEPGSTA